MIPICTVDAHSIAKGIPTTVVESRHFYTSVNTSMHYAMHIVIQATSVSFQSYLKGNIYLSTKTMDSLVDKLVESLIGYLLA